jgi:RNA polymerase sigma factor (sigma-70 family)
MKQDESRKTAQNRTGLPQAHGPGEQERSLIEQVLHEDIGYIYDPMYAKRHVGRRIFADKVPDDAPRGRTDLAWLTKDFLPQMDGPPAAHPLTGKQELTLFRQLNFCRYKISRLRERLRRGGPRARLLAKMVLLQRIALKVRNRLVEANLPLVISMAKRSRHDNVDFSDLISEGNVALLRAVDKFDCARGFKFSTYACRAILKSFTRISLKASRYRSRFPTEYDPALEKSDWTETQRELLRDGMVGELRGILEAEDGGELIPVEREVLAARFGLGSAKLPMTLEQVGVVIGVTKERVRQIQNKALAKLKDALEQTVFTAS